MHHFRARQGFLTRIRRAHRLACEPLEDRRMFSGLSISGTIVAPPIIDLPFITFESGSWVTGFSSESQHGEETGDVFYFHPDQVKLAFWGYLNAIGESDPHSVTNPSNWQLFRDGVDISSLIASIEYVVPQNASDSYVLLSFGEQLEAGPYQIVALDSIHDIEDHPLNGDRDDSFGGNAVVSFQVSPVLAASTETIVDADHWSRPAIASDAAGNYVLAWIGPLRVGHLGDPGGNQVIAQRFNADGVAVGAQIVVAEVEHGLRYNGVQIEMTADGRFVVAWRATNYLVASNSVFPAASLLRQFTAEGEAVGEVFGVDGTRDPLTDFAIAPDGTLLVVSVLNRHWPFIPAAQQDPEQGPTVFVSRYSAEGTLLDGTLRLGLGLGGSVSLGADGSYVVTWQDKEIPSRGVLAQWFNADGTRRGEPIQVSWRVGKATAPVVVTDPYGNAVVAWLQESNGQRQVLVQRITAAGVFLGGAIQVDSGEESVAPDWPVLEMRDDGSFVVAWSVQTDELSPIRVRGFNSSAVPQVEIFSLGDATSQLSGLQFTFGKWDRLIAAWSERQGGGTTSVGRYQLHVRHFDALSRQLLVDLNGDPPGIDYRANFVHGGQPVAIANPDQVRIHADEFADLTTLTIEIEGYVPGDLITFELPSDWSHGEPEFSEGRVRFYSYHARELFEKLLQSARFSTTANRPVGSQVKIRIVVEDGSNYETLYSEPAFAKISIHVPGRSNIAGRHVFYNNSSFDGNNPAANSGDDAAIATDKSALLPGQTATFANYTSYIRGINGIIIDLAGEHGTITPDDFIFRIGNGNDTAHWAYAPEPLSVVVRPGAGANGSDRVEIVWADDAIKNLWLQVIVLDNGNTGLAASDTFFFGNHVGDTGNEPDQVRTTTTDLMRAVNHILSDPGGQTPAAIDSTIDFNRDGRVTTHDVMAAVNQILQRRDPLELITINSATAQAGAITAGLIVSFEPDAPLIQVVIAGLESTQYLVAEPQAAVLQEWDPQEEEVEFRLAEPTPTLLMTDPDRV